MSQDKPSIFANSGYKEEKVDDLAWLKKPKMNKVDIGYILLTFLLLIPTMIAVHFTSRVSQFASQPFNHDRNWLYFPNVVTTTSIDMILVFGWTILFSVVGIALWRTGWVEVKEMFTNRFVGRSLLVSLPFTYFLGGYILTLIMPLFVPMFLVAIAIPIVFVEVVLTPWAYLK